MYKDLITLHSYELISEIEAKNQILTTEERALHGAWAILRSSRIFEKTDLEKIYGINKDGIIRWCRKCEAYLKTRCSRTSRNIIVFSLI